MNRPVLARNLRGWGASRRWVLAAASLPVSCAAAQTLPRPQPMPKPPALGAEASVTMQDPATFAPVRLDFPIAAGPFQPTWESIAANYPGVPAWLRQAKFGIWVHFGPQSAGQSGDWYARRMYQQGTNAYDNHIRDFGHPSESGYKDVLHTWNPTRLDPAALVKLYKEAGARFLIVQGVHHDNFDNWDSKYQPWNSVNVGPHRDLLGEWKRAARSEGIRYGVAFHHEYTWWWYQPAFGADASGPKKGVPYDAARLTAADGKGTWWEGLDPALLYGINLREYKDLGDATGQYRPDAGIFQFHQEYARWYATRWALRIEDVIQKYDPDFIYTDGDSTGPFSGYKTGTGTKNDAIERVLADFYNHSLATRGKVDTFAVVKFHPPANGIVSTVESRYPKDIKRDQDWIGENAAGDWFYAPGFTYSARGLVMFLLETVSRDGSYAVNIPIRPDGSLEPATVTMLHEVGQWMRVNGEAIYASRAWVKFGEGVPDANGLPRGVPGHALGREQADFVFGPQDFRFTVGSDGALYVFALAPQAAGTRVVVTSLGSQANLLGQPVRSVRMLGNAAKVQWKQTAAGLEITMPAGTPVPYAAAFRVETAVSGAAGTARRR